MSELTIRNTKKQLPVFSSGDTFENLVDDISSELGVVGAQCASRACRFKNGPRTKRNESPSCTYTSEA